MKSASAWQGCSRSLSPFTTGTAACSANSSTVAWVKVRSTMPSTQRSRFFAMSWMGSRSPSRECVWSTKNVLPPSELTPASKVRRVRSDGFSKKSTTILPSSVPRKSCGFALRRRESWRRFSSSAGRKSAIEIRSRCSAPRWTEGAFGAERSSMVRLAMLHRLSRDRLRNQHRFERLQHGVHVLALDDVGRQEAQHGFMGTVDEDAALEHRGDCGLCDRCGFQLDADHQSAHPDLGRSEEHTSELQSRQ